MCDTFDKFKHWVESFEVNFAIFIFLFCAQFMNWVYNFRVTKLTSYKTHTI